MSSSLVEAIISPSSSFVVHSQLTFWDTVECGSHRIRWWIIQHTKKPAEKSKCWGREDTWDLSNFFYYSYSLFRVYKQRHNRVELSVNKQLTSRVQKGGLHSWKIISTIMRWKMETLHRYFFSYILSWTSKEHFGAIWLDCVVCCEFWVCRPARFIFHLGAGREMMEATSSART